MSDAVATMGTILPDDVGGRDAMHVAVIAATAAHKLAPGQHVGVIGEGVSVGVSADPVGIVDPFLEESVKLGQRFWLYLYPRSITSLRHNWTHPKFPDNAVEVLPVAKVDSEQWLRDFIGRSDCPSYDTIMRAIKGENVNDNYFSVYIDQYAIQVGGQNAGGEIPPEFWAHVENVLGHKVEFRPKYFSCSC